MLSIPTNTVAWIIARAREFEAMDAVSGSGRAALELESWIADLTDTQRAELVAIFWLGRATVDDGDADDFDALMDEARANLDKPTAPYLMRSPMLADCLEEGLAALGHDIEELETGAG